MGYNIGITLKHFFGNSFYLKPGVFYRSQYKVSDVKTNSDAEVTSTKEGHIKDAGFSLRVGQSWHWESFLIGCDWAGVAKPIFNFERSGDLEEEDGRYLEISLLNLYVGMSF